MDPILKLTDAADEEARAVIGEGLNAHNVEAAGYEDRRPLTVLVSDPFTGKVIGGVIGRTSFGLLFIDLVYLPATLRGLDIGTRMISMAEEEARRRGCRAGVLYTISFQAPGFYERLGWRVFGEIPCEPPGTSRVFMTKDFR
ncbi:MAG: GNAT family N-acetyltransferase [Hyphomicrobiales bacterium]